ncbi:cilia- and flagella-associated protein 161 isoform X2 [Echinops telfairi]|uniref:Cilia- and flagella-associated protein 161 isoform X2 n=1 Tax=Echinops telfairi TaxID=9371 RepID=A0AC55CS46_ECHTE|nr:cilia- and flagella-associated protein 161 isoform X2 [Echinops telfairi]
MAHESGWATGMRTSTLRRIQPPPPVLLSVTIDPSDFTRSLSNQELMKDFLEKREKGKLLIQRNRKLKGNLLRQMQLSVSEDGSIHYGDKVMLVNPDHVDPEAAVFLAGDLSLCMTPDEIKAHLSEELEVPCGLSAAPTKNPVGRNTFVVLSMDRNANGQVLRYGEDFCLGIMAGFEDKMLYLASDHRSLLKSAKKSWLQEVSLVDEISYLTCWQAAYLDPQLRLEYEGMPIATRACHEFEPTPRSLWEILQPGPCP